MMSSMYQALFWNVVGNKTQKIPTHMGFIF